MYPADSKHGYQLLNYLLPFGFLILPAATLAQKPGLALVIEKVLHFFAIAVPEIPNSLASSVVGRLHTNLGAFYTQVFYPTIAYTYYGFLRTSKNLLEFLGLTKHALTFSTKPCSFLFKA